MNFHKCLNATLDKLGIKEEELVSMLHVRPDTARRWMAGKLLMGRKKLFILLDGLNISSEDRDLIIKLHSQELKQSAKRGGSQNEFTEMLTEALGSYTLTEISEKTEISYKNLSNWVSGKMLPSTDNLFKISKSLGLNSESTDKLMTARENQKAKKPFGRKRNSQKVEEVEIKKLLRRIPKSDVGPARAPNVSFLYKSKPVVINFNTSNYEVLFTRCCLVILKTNAEAIFLLVDRPLPEPFDELYKKFKIIALTPEEFLGKQIKDI